MGVGRGGTGPCSLPFFLLHRTKNICHLNNYIFGDPPPPPPPPASFLDLPPAPIADKKDK